MPQELTELTQISALITFVGLALASAALIGLTWLRLKAIKGETYANAPKWTRLAIGGTVIGVAIAFGGMMWLRSSATGMIDQRGVMAALYAEYTPPEGSEGGVMVWHRTAIDFKDSAGYARLASSLKGLKRETYEAFLTANQTEQPVTDDLGLDFPVLIITEEDAERIRSEGAMMGLVAMGWTGIHSHSAPGFDADRTQALVYQAIICGPLCGMGQAHLFTRDEDGVWVLSATADLWIS